MTPFFSTATTCWGTNDSELVVLVGIMFSMALKNYPGKWCRHVLTSLQPETFFFPTISLEVSIRGNFGALKGLS